MSGLDGVLARVGEIESRIVALDPAIRGAAEAASATSATSDAATGSASATTFAGLLEAAKIAIPEASGARASTDAADQTTAAASLSTVSATQTSAGTAELATALQTLFAANTGSTGGSSPLTQYAGLIG